jgi:lysophospholipase L1-like esterase
MRAAVVVLLAAVPLSTHTSSGTPPPPAPGDTSCGTPPSALATDGRTNVLLLGDSISMGYGCFKGKDCPGTPHPSDRAWPDGRLGYGLYVQELLASNASVQHSGGWYLGGQAGDTAGTAASSWSSARKPCNWDGCGGGTRCLKQWLGANSSTGGYLAWDVISINFGCAAPRLSAPRPPPPLSPARHHWQCSDPEAPKPCSPSRRLHDLGGSGPVREVPLSNYTENLGWILNEASKTGAEVIFTTTTPVPADYPPGSRTEKNVVAYNAAAAQVAGTYCVAVNDLHGAIVGACPPSYPRDGNCSALQWPKGVHFVHAGRELCGKVVAGAIVAAMDRQAARLRSRDGRARSKPCHPVAVGGGTGRAAGVSAPPPPPPQLLGEFGRAGSSCTVRLKANCKHSDLNLSLQFSAATVGDCCTACQANWRCTAFTVDARKAVPGRSVGACYLKANCSGLYPDELSISGMADGAPFPNANRSFTNCSAPTFPAMCAAADNPGACHWCGSAAAGACYAKRTACPAL